MRSETSSTIEPANGQSTDESCVENSQPFRFLKTTSLPTVACYPLLSIDRAMEQAGIQSVKNAQNDLGVFIGKSLSKLHLMRNVRYSAAGPVFVSFMGFSESKILPFAYWTEIVPYCFDCWPAGYERWAAWFTRQRVRLAFFSARQSAEYFSDRIPNMKSKWLPEATDTSGYDPTKSWAERDIDVLELGRKNDRFHERIAQPLADMKKTHLFERVKGEIIFPDRAGLVSGLARSKISICFPCSITHPARSGAVETVTHRYFESMASKCLIVGHAPRELIDLFGYNPVIEIEEGDEVQQVRLLLANQDLYQNLVDRNFRRLLEVGTWNSRIETVLSTIQNFYS